MEECHKPAVVREDVFIAASSRREDLILLEQLARRVVEAIGIAPPAHLHMAIQQPALVVAKVSGMVCQRAGNLNRGYRYVWDAGHRVYAGEIRPVVVRVPWHRGTCSEEVVHALNVVAAQRHTDNTVTWRGHSPRGTVPMGNARTQERMPRVYRVHNR